MKHAKYMVKNNVRFGDENDITPTLVGTEFPDIA
jgi:hypothetical protein